MKDNYYFRHEPGYLTDPEEEPDYVFVEDLYGDTGENSYLDFLESDYWAEVRRTVLHRDGHRCAHCNSRYNLQVHHKSYCKRGTELENLHILETICKGCHKHEHH